MTAFSRALETYRDLPTFAKTIIQAALSFFVFYGGAIAEDKIQTDWKTDSVGPLAIKVFVLAVVFILFVAVGYAFRQQINYLELRDTGRKRQLAYASSLMDQFVSKQISAFENQRVSSGPQPHPAILELMLADISRIALIVQSAYQCFESQFGDSEKIDNRVEFEVTFMTKSYRDEFITIPAYANRYGRAPHSMQKRKENPKVFEDSMTAMVYKSPRHDMRLIEDTADPAASYVELYPGQKMRIRSSVIYPILSEQNALLGTLVVHCNHAFFFRTGDSKFWSELLEIFARRLALEKVRLDFVYKHKDKQTDVPF
jgi:GAF domain-containing protein